MAALRTSEQGRILAGVGVRLNRDDLGLPQNEESITACGQSAVLGGTNDYRGLVDPKGNFTGWHLSTNGGQSLNNEGLLPPVREKGQAIESGGDPVAKAGPGCSLYMADLNYDQDFLPNGIGVYKSDPETLAGCPGGTAASCWPLRKAVAVNSGDKVFLDKPWMYVGKSGGKSYVWTVYTEFRCPGRRLRVGRLQLQQHQGRALRREPQQLHAPDPDQRRPEEHPVRRRDGGSRRSHIHHLGVGQRPQDRLPTAGTHEVLDQGGASQEHALRAGTPGGEGAPEHGDRAAARERLPRGHLPQERGRDGGRQAARLRRLGRVQGATG